MLAPPREVPWRAWVVRGWDGFEGWFEGFGGWVWVWGFGGGLGGGCSEVGLEMGLEVGLRVGFGVGGDHHRVSAGAKTRACPHPSLLNQAKPVSHPQPPTIQPSKPHQHRPALEVDAIHGAPGQRHRL